VWSSRVPPRTVEPSPAQGLPPRTCLAETPGAAKPVRVQTAHRVSCSRPTVVSYPRAAGSLYRISEPLWAAIDSAGATGSRLRLPRHPGADAAEDATEAESLTFSGLGHLSSREVAGVLGGTLKRMAKYLRKRGMLEAGMLEAGVLRAGESETETRPSSSRGPYRPWAEPARITMSKPLPLLGAPRQSCDYAASGPGSRLRRAWDCQ
jgi:hypothetical protein